MVAARVIIGGAMNYVLWEMIGFSAHLPMEADVFVEELVEVVWRGLKPRGRARRKKR